MGTLGMSNMFDYDVCGEEYLKKILQIYLKKYGQKYGQKDVPDVIIA